MGSIDEVSFSAPAEAISVNGLLFDFDGTIVDSTDAIVKHWHKEAASMNMDPNVILAASHGRRSIDTFGIFDPSKANWEYINKIESQIPREYGRDAIEIPGARKLLSSLEAANAPWAVVTSGTRGLLDGWIEVLKLAHPRTLVVAEDVEKGKPDPACYLLGRDRLRLDKDSTIIVIEDAPSGIRAGKAAGFRVIGLTTTHTIDQVREAGADWIVQDLRSVTMQNIQDGTVQIEIKDALVEN